MVLVSDVLLKPDAVDVSYPVINLLLKGKTEVWKIWILRVKCAPLGAVLECSWSHKHSN